MCVYVKITAVLIALSAFVCVIPSNVGAQPFGFKAPQEPQKSHQAVLSTTQGRFAFGQISDSSEDKFMLDTFTGRLWRLTNRADIGLCLTVVPYRNEEGECTPLPVEIPEAERKELKDK
jgi:hypothetical protein